MTDQLKPNQRRCPKCSKEGLPNDMTVDLKHLGTGRGKPHCVTCLLKGRITPLQAPTDDDPEIR